MKAFIFAYNYNKKTYYGEGYSEEVIRKLIEEKLKLPNGTLEPGRRPSFELELKKIWDKKNREYYLTIKKEDTIDQNELELNKKKQHVLYELDLLIKEDEKFLSGINDFTVKNSQYLPNKKTYHSTEDQYMVIPYFNTGYTMSYKNNKGDNDIIYRFRRLTDAYWYVRNNIIELGLSENPYRKNHDITNLEICDSFIAGFGNPTTININNKSDKYLPIGLLKN